MHHDEHETTRNWLQRAIGVLRGGSMPWTNEVEVEELHQQVQDELTASVPSSEETGSQTWAYAGLVNAIKRCAGGGIAFEDEEDEVE
nr:hypothetical protein [Oscillochloris trichoides]